MKKLISLLLVLTLALSLVGGAGIAAFADTEPIEAAPVEAVAEEPAPMVEEASADEPAPAEEPAPVEEEAPAQEEAPAEEEAANEESPEEAIAAEPAPETAAEEAVGVSEAAQAAASASTLTSGSFVIGVKAGDKVMAIALKDGAIAAVEWDPDTTPDASMVWTIEVGSNGSKVSNSGSGLYYNGSKTGLATTSRTMDRWNLVSGSLSYTGGQNADTLYYVGFSGGSFTLSSSETGAVFAVWPASGSSADTGSENNAENNADNTSSSDAATFSEWRGPFQNAEDGTSLAFDIGGKTIKFDHGQLSTADVVMDGEKMVIDYNFVNIKAKDGGYTLYTDAPENKLDCLYINSEGKLANTGMDGTEPAGYWTIEEGGGPSSTVFAYHDGETVWYLTLDESNSIVGTKDSSAAKKGNFYSGSAPEDKGGPGGPGRSEKVDELAPVVVKQPQVSRYVLEGSGFAAPTFSVTAQLPEYAEGVAPPNNVYFQWYVSGEAVGDPVKISVKDDLTSTFTAESLAGKEAGVYPVYCQISCKILDDSGEPVEHSVKCYTVNFVVCKGVKENTIFTFSDVHEVWDNIGVAVNDTILATGGYIPSLVIATGDYNNSYVAGWGEDLITKCIDTMIQRIRLQVAGIDTVWVSGNHDNGYATGFTNANKEADLGLDEANYYDVEKSISGTGIIYDSRNAPAAETSKDNDGLIVIGINYEDIGSQGAYANPSTGRPADPSKLDYGTEGSTGTVYEHLKAALDNAAKNYNGELVIISTHAGIHTLGVDPSSKAAGASEWSGGNDYSVTNSAAVVELVNSYVEKYDMDILWLFGHDHSKGEGEFFKVPGDTVISTVSYADKTTKEIELKFAYAHSGYITDNIGGKEVYSLLTWDNQAITRTAKVADGAQTAKPALDFTVSRLKVNVAALIPTADITAKITGALPKGYAEKDIVFYDVNAFWADETEATEAEVKADGGVDFLLPYPAGTTAEGYDFAVLHLKDDGTVEVLTPEETKDGLLVHADSLSPFAVVYKVAEKAPAANSKTDNTKKKSARSPKTGDDSSIALWAVVLVLCAGTAVILPRRKFDK